MKTPFTVSKKWSYIDYVELTGLKWTAFLKKLPMPGGAMPFSK